MIPEWIIWILAIFGVIMIQYFLTKFTYFLLDDYLDTDMIVFVFVFAELILVTALIVYVIQFIYDMFQVPKRLDSIDKKLVEIKCRKR